MNQKQKVAARKVAAKRNRELTDRRAIRNRRLAQRFAELYPGVHARERAAIDAELIADRGPVPGDD
jgi:hypothetical protein